MNIELTPEHEKILSELSNVKGYDKNVILNKYKNQIREIKYILDQKILEAEFILCNLKEKRDSVKYYDDGIDPY
mgnify:CR=1 FL=1